MREKPIIQNLKEPLWTVIIPTYNCAKYLDEALSSVTKQFDYKNGMQIIVVDDHSTEDDPSLIVNKYQNYNISYFQQEINVGKARNYDTGLDRAKGELIHILHGDDTVAENFYERFAQFFSDYPAIEAAFSRSNYIDAEGKVFQQTGIERDSDGPLEGFEKRIAVWQRIQPPSLVVKKKVYEELGGYNKDLTHSEDWEFYVRVALKYRFGFINEVLANYRVFQSNSSTKSLHHGRRVDIIRNVLPVIDAQLPEELRSSIRKDRRKEIVNYFLIFLPKYLVKRDYRGYFKTLFYILKQRPPLRLIARALKVSLTYRKYA